MGTAAKYNRSYNGDRDVTLSTEVDTNSSSTIYTLNAVQQHSFGNTSPSSTLFYRCSFQHNTSMDFATYPIQSKVFFNQVRQHTLQKLVLNHARSATFLAQKMLAFHHISVDAIQGFWSSYSQNHGQNAHRFLVIRLTKPRHRSSQVLGYPIHKTSRINLDFVATKPKLNRCLQGKPNGCKSTNATGHSNN